MGKYFGKEPRYSREEAEAQAKQAIDALVSRGRPPADEWKGLANRMGDINRELATRPPVDLPPPPPRQAEPAEGTGPARRRDLSQLLRPRPPVAPEPAPSPIAEAAHEAPPAAPPRAKRATPAKRAAPRVTRAAAPAPAPAPVKAAKAVKKAAKRSTATTAANPPAKRATPAKRAAVKKRSG